MMALYVYNQILNNFIICHFSEKSINFNKQVDGVNSIYVGEPYNYHSIMHYDSYAFSKQPRVLKTMVPLDPNVELIENQKLQTLPQGDVNQINNFYECKID